MIPLKYLHTVEAVSNIILWNNKLICVDGKLFYLKRCKKKGILRLAGLLDENNDFITKSKLRELNISPLEAFNPFPSKGFPIDE